MILTYVVTLLTFLSVDLIWLLFICRTLYVDQMGSLMRLNVNIPAAIAFYLLYAFGIVLFAVLPLGQNVHWQKSLMLGAGFGLVAYGTYDLTALAVIKDFPLRLAMIDLAWGAVLTGIVAAVGSVASEYL